MKNGKKQNRKKMTEYIPEKKPVLTEEPKEDPSVEIEIVRKAITGDKEAFALLFTDTYRQMYFAARKYLQRDEDIYDAMQDGYLKAYKYLANLSPAELFVPWLKKIIENAAKDVYTNVYAHGAVSYEEHEAECSLPDDTEDILRRADIQEVLSRMNPEQVEVLSLYFYDGMKLSEIAEMKGQPASTVRSRFSAAKKELIKLLKEKDIDKSLYSGSISAMIAVSLRAMIGTNILSAATAQQMLDEILNSEPRKSHEAAYILLKRQRNKAVLKAVSLLMAMTVVITCITGTIIFTLKEQRQNHTAQTPPAVTGSENNDLSNNTPDGNKQDGTSGLPAEDSGNTDAENPDNSEKEPVPPENPEENPSENIGSHQPPVPPENNSDNGEGSTTGEENTPSTETPPKNSSTDSPDNSTEKPPETSTGKPPDTSAQKPTDTTPKDDFVPDYRPGKENTTMRIPNNLFQEGEVDIQDEWIYFVRNYYTIDKVKQNGTGNTALCETRGTITSLNVIGDWIYYVEDANGLYRIRTDGTMQERLIGGYVCDIAYVIGNDIYYSMPTNPQRTTWSVYRYNIETKGFVSVLHGLSSKCFYMNENHIFYTAHPYAGTSSYGSPDYNSQFKVYSLKTKKSHIVFEESGKYEYNIWTDGDYAYWWTPEGIRRVNYTKENTQPEYIYQDTDLRLCFLNTKDHRLGFIKDTDGYQYLYLLDTVNLQAWKTDIKMTLFNRYGNYYTFEAGWIWGKSPQGGLIRKCYDGNGIQFYR